MEKTNKTGTRSTATVNALRRLANTVSVLSSVCVMYGLRMMCDPHYADRSTCARYLSGYRPARMSCEPVTGISSRVACALSLCMSCGRCASCGHSRRSWDQIITATALCTCAARRLASLRLRRSRSPTVARWIRSPLGFRPDRRALPFDVGCTVQERFLESKDCVTE